MPLRSYPSGYEHVDELPLVTDSATVTAVEPLDRSRNDEVERRVVELLDVEGDEDWVQFYPDGDPNVDWDRVADYLDAADRPHGDLEAALSTLYGRYERPYPSLLQVRVDPDQHVAFAPGQYVTLRFRDTPRAYSVACSPNDEGLEFCIRRVPGGHLTPELFEDLEVGDTVTVRGPNGEFTLKEPSHRDVAFLATGTGVAPLRSMIEYTFEEGLDAYAGEKRDVWLFLGCGWEDDLAYREQFRELDAEHDNFHFVPTLSRENTLTEWDGETAYVQHTLVKYLEDGADLPADLARYHARDPAYDVDARLDPDAMEVYACGVNAMVNSLEETARAVGVPDDCLEAEGYG